MNSLGSSKWPSYDSLTSTSSFLFSETEDEADVFSEGEGESGIVKSSSGDERVRNYLSGLHSTSKSVQPERCCDETKHPDAASSPGAAMVGSAAATPGDLAFAQKCADLQRFIRPLLELLHGLKTGRFDKGLSSFQQSVAIDRLQRILGVLQRPEMGEKYLQNLLQIEMMLKMWFPRVALNTSDTPNQTSTPRLRPHWCQNQLHMPVKKRKLSWLDPDGSDGVAAKRTLCQHEKGGSCQAASPPDPVSTHILGSPENQSAPEEEPAEFKYSRLLYSCSSREKVSLPSSCGSPATQDSSVSSSDSMTTSHSP